MYKQISKICIVLFFVSQGACQIQMNLPERESSDAQIYIANCQMCHALPHPGRHTTSEWEHVLSMMEHRRMERKIPEMPTEHTEAILRYLDKHSR